MNVYTVYIIIMSIVVFIAVLWVNFGLLISLDSSAIPTVVNGITSSASIMLGLSGVIIGTMLRDTHMDKKTKTFYYVALVLILLPLTMLWLTYTFLTIGSLGSWDSYVAVRFAISGLIETLYIFFIIVVHTVRISGIE